MINIQVISSGNMVKLRLQMVKFNHKVKIDLIISSLIGLTVSLLCLSGLRLDIRLEMVKLKY